MGEVVGRSTSMETGASGKGNNRLYKLLLLFPEEQQEKIAIFLSNPLTIIGLLLLLFWIFVAIFAHQLAPYPEEAGGVVHLEMRFLPPSKEFLGGTDHLGLDVLSLVILGSRVSILSGVLPIMTSLIAGVVLGSIAGYFRGSLETIIMRGADIFLAMPRLILAIAITAALGRSITNAMIAVAVVST